MYENNDVHHILAELWYQLTRIPVNILCNLTRVKIAVDHTMSVEEMLISLELKLNLHHLLLSCLSLLVPASSYINKGEYTRSLDT